MIQKGGWKVWLKNFRQRSWTSWTTVVTASFNSFPDYEYIIQEIVIMSTVEMVLMVVYNGVIVRELVVQDAYMVGNIDHSLLF
jgi:hypothetical protein